VMYVDSIDKMCRTWRDDIIWNLLYVECNVHSSCWNMS